MKKRLKVYLRRFFIFFHSESTFFLIDKSKEVKVWLDFYRFVKI